MKELKFAGASNVELAKSLLKICISAGTIALSLDNFINCSDFIKVASLIFYIESFDYPFDSVDLSERLHAIDEDCNVVYGLPTDDYNVAAGLGVIMSWLSDTSWTLNIYS